MSSPDLIDERFEEIVRELRAARPVASDELRERVSALPGAPAAGSAPRRRLPSLRRTMLVLAPACLAVAVGAAVVHGLVSSGGPPRGRGASGQLLHPSSQTFAPAGRPAATVESADKAQAGQAPTSASNSRSALPPSGNRLQQYDAWLRVRVRNLDQLSRDTKRAMQVARSFGGYVAFVDYNTPSGTRGDSYLELRVPVDRVDEAVARFTSLGVLVAQRISVKDVQRQVIAETKSIAALKARIAQIESLLRGSSLTPDQRAQLEVELTLDRRNLAGTVRAKDGLVRRAELARVSLTLTTKKPHGAAAHRGRLGRTLDDAGSVLAKEAAVLLYLLVVAGPLLLLGAAAVALVRLRGRRLAQHLLDRA